MSACQSLTIGARCESSSSRSASSSWSRTALRCAADFSCATSLAGRSPLRVPVSSNLLRALVPEQAQTEHPTPNGDHSTCSHVLSNPGAITKVVSSSDRCCKNQHFPHDYCGVHASQRSVSEPLACLIATSHAIDPNKFIHAINPSKCIDAPRGVKNIDAQSLRFPLVPS